MMMMRLTAVGSGEHCVEACLFSLAPWVVGCGPASSSSGERKNWLSAGSQALPPPPLCLRAYLPGTCAPCKHSSTDSPF